MDTISKWIDVKHALPEKNNDHFYGDRYSIPVIVANIVTGQVQTIPHMYDYKTNMWIWESLEDGTDPEGYEIIHITHWMRYPKIKEKP